MAAAASGNDENSEDTRYLALLRRIVESMTELVGEQYALRYARKAPLDISADGTVTAYYGTGEKALDILITRYEGFLGETVADSRIKKEMADLDQDDRALLPERVRPDSTAQKSQQARHWWKHLFAVANH